MDHDITVQRKRIFCTFKNFVCSVCNEYMLNTGFERNIVMDAQVSKAIKSFAALD